MLIVSPLIIDVRRRAHGPDRDHGCGDRDPLRVDRDARLRDLQGDGFAGIELDRPLGQPQPTPPPAPPPEPSPAAPVAVRLALGVRRPGHHLDAVLDADRLRVAHLQVVVVLDDPVEVLLGVEVDVLRALLVLEGQLVGLVGAPPSVLCDLITLFVLLSGSLYGGIILAL